MKMTKFDQKSFSIGAPSKQYKDNYDKIFGKKNKLRELTEMSQELRVYKELECDKFLPVWELDINECGWECDNCSIKIGFSRELDNKYLIEKIYSILFYLDYFKFIRVSNSTHADLIKLYVAEQCEKEGVKDQYSIIHHIVGYLRDSHADFWKHYDPIPQEDKEEKFTSSLEKLKK